MTLGHIQPAIVEVEPRTAHFPELSVVKEPEEVVNRENEITRAVKAKIAAERVLRDVSDEELLAIGQKTVAQSLLSPSPEKIAERDEIQKLALRRSVELYEEITLGGHLAAEQ